MRRYPEDAWERAMKVQEVILRAMARKITWWQAAEIIGLSDRSMRRWRGRYEQHGYDGLFDRRRGKPSPKRVPVETVEEVLRLYQERYHDFNVRHFHEKLREEHGMELSYTWVKLALQGAGLVRKARQRGVHRKRRPRRPLPGMLLHLDGSSHQWFQDERWYDLIEVLDDATSETYYAQLVEEESTRTVMTALREVIERQGLFCALYSDRASHFFVTPQAGGPVDPRRLIPQRGMGRALKELGIHPARRDRPIRRKRGGGASGALGLGKDGCRRSCGWRGSGRWRRRISSCGNAISRRSTGSLRCRPPRAGTPLCRWGARTCIGSSQCNRSGWWPRTIRCAWGTGRGSWSGRAGEGRWRVAG